MSGEMMLPYCDVGGTPGISPPAGSRMSGQASGSPGESSSFKERGSPRWSSSLTQHGGGGRSASLSGSPCGWSGVSGGDCVTWSGLRTSAGWVRSRAAASSPTSNL